MEQHSRWPAMLTWGDRIALPEPNGKRALPSHGATVKCISNPASGRSSKGKSQERARDHKGSRTKLSGISALWLSLSTKVHEPSYFTKSSFYKDKEKLSRRLGKSTRITAAWSRNSHPASLPAITSQGPNVHQMDLQDSMEPLDSHHQLQLPLAGGDPWTHHLPSVDRSGALLPGPEPTGLRPLWPLD